jgi:uncharacterized protein (TIGR02596 family)
MRALSSNAIAKPALHRGRSRAFTLVELLVVITIAAILSAVTLPTFFSLQGSYNLSAAGQVITAQLGLARQNALAYSHPVQVRFYQVADYNSATPVFRAMQCFLEGDSGTTAISKPYFFPAPIRVFQATSGGVDVSSLLTQSYSGITVVASGDPTITANPLPPPIGTSYQYSFFRFRPNGMTDLSTATSTTTLLTIGLETAPIVAATSLPKNYVTLQLNALSGVVTVYRP